MTSTRAAFTIAALLWSSAPLFGQAINTLSEQERAQGWQLLFDGRTLAGWHVSVPAPVSGRGGSPTPAAPGQVGTPKPCVAAQGEPTPAGGSHWQVADGSVIACGEPAGY